MTTRPPMLELTIDIEASPEQVWQALTDPARLACWFPLHSEAREGDRLLLSWGKDCEWETHVTRAEPQRHVQWMDQLPDPDQPDQLLPVVDFHIETAQGGTRLRLVQSGFDPDSDFSAQYDALRRGWSQFLDLLGLYLAHHFGSRREMLWRRGRCRGSRSETWQALLTALGIASEALPAPGSMLEAALGERRQMVQLRLAEAPHVLALQWPDLGQANLFVELEPGEEPTSCGIWLSTYGMAPEQREALDEAIQALANRLLEQD